MKPIISSMLAVFAVVFVVGCSATTKPHRSTASTRVASHDYSQYPIIEKFVIPSRVLKGGSLREGMSVQEMHSIMGTNALSVTPRSKGKVHTYPATDCIENVDGINRLPEDVKQGILVSGQCSITVVDGAIVGWNFQGINVKSSTFCRSYVTVSNGTKHCLSGLPYEVIIR